MRNRRANTSSAVARTPINTLRSCMWISSNTCGWTQSPKTFYFQSVMMRVCLFVCFVPALRCSAEWWSWWRAWRICFVRRWDRPSCSWSNTARLPETCPRSGTDSSGNSLTKKHRDTAQPRMEQPDLHLECFTFGSHSGSSSSSRECPLPGLHRPGPELYCPSAHRHTAEDIQVTCVHVLYWRVNGYIMTDDSELLLDFLHQASWLWSHRASPCLRPRNPCSSHDRSQLNVNKNSRK